MFLRRTTKRWVERLQDVARAPKEVSRSLALGMAVVGVLLFGGTALCLVLPTVVRERANAVAARHGVALRVHQVAPAWFGLTLRGVQVTSVEGEAVDGTLSEVRVALTPSLAVASVELNGGAIAFRGAPSSLREALRLRGGEKGAGAVDVDSSSKVRRPLSVRLHGVDMRWDGPATADERCELTGIDGVVDTSGDVNITVAGAVASRATSTVTAHEVTFRYAKPELIALRAHDADVTVSWPSADASLPPSAAGPGQPHPADAGAPRAAVLDPPVLPRGKEANAGRKSNKEGPAGRLFDVPSLATTRRRLALLAQALASSLAVGADIHIDGLRLRLASRLQTLVLGPGTFAVERPESVLRATFEAPSSVGGPPILLTIVLPLGDGDVTVAMEGGPIPIGLVAAGAAARNGAHESGTLEGKVHLTLGDALEIQSAVQARGLVLEHPALASAALEDVNVDVHVDARVDESGNIQLHRSSIELGTLEWQMDGALEQDASHSRGRFHFALPPTPCQSALASIPAALVPSIARARVGGTLALKGKLEFDTNDLTELVLDYSVADACDFTGVPPLLAKERLTSSFTHHIYHPDGTSDERTTGPDEPNWTPLSSISPWMTTAVLTTEDGGFFKHRGFSHGAIRGALIADLKAGKFVRGASTISMQVAKNLFLGREKTLSRKLEELLLTEYLEQIFTKDELLEIYFNIIEFGPDIYGIRDAALHYFGRTPDELNAIECYFLASLLPAPVRYQGMFDKGEVPAGWRRHIEQLMRAGGRVGLMTPEELTDSLAAPIELRKEGAPPPPARRPGALRRAPSRDGDDADWGLEP